MSLVYRFYVGCVIYLFTPQGVVVCTLSKQEVLQQPEEANQAWTERQGHALSLPQV